MKIIFCDNTLWGLVNFRGEVIRHFISEGHQVVLVAPEKEDKQMQTTIPDGVRYIPVAMGRTSLNPTKDIKYFLRMLRIFRREKPDYIFTYTIKPNIYGSIAARLAGCRSTAMMAGLGYIFINDSLVLRAARSLYRFGLSFAQHLMVLNDYNRKLVERKHMCDPKKIVFLEGGEGINIDKYEKYDNASASTTFLFIGRILWDKGYDEFSRAARKVKALYPEARFELLGSMDPSYPKNVPEERLRQDEADSTLKYIGFTHDMDSVYRRRGIVITLPSYSEGMNRALMEASASGKPIITSDIPGCREAVDDGRSGFLVPPRDADALADAMLRYLRMTEEEKKQFSDRSRAKAESLFDVRSVIEKYEKIISGIEENKKKTGK